MCIKLGAMTKGRTASLLCLLLLVTTRILIAPAVVKAQAQENEFPKGTVIDKVVSKTDSTKTYALYLPTTYSPARQFPIIYCFDPAARGALPITHLKEAAEKYNYIVVGSNNSRNGVNLPTSEIVRDLWADTHTRFSIDDRRVYLAGFSGGARVAIGVGLWLSGKIAGVIACGGGFPVGMSPTKPRSFVLFETAGTEDFNKPEMQSLFHTLESSTPAVRLTVFEGGHNWLPKEAAIEAVEWFELHAIKSGTRERDQAWIDKLFEQNLELATTADKANEQYRAYLRYADLVRDFSGLRDVSTAEKRYKELGSSKELREALKRDKWLDEEQVRRTQNIHSLFASLGGAEDRFESKTALRDALSDQRKQAEATEPSSNRTVARRVVQSLFIEFFERGNNAISQRQYEDAITNLSACTEIQPANPRTFYQLARAYALAGDKRNALTALRTAADKGFAGTEDLSSRDFAELQNDKRFLEIRDLVVRNAEKK
jgi:poly(3-hydroxybutyrate) depolymerase